MSNRKTLVAVGLVTFVVILVAMFPARVASQWLVPKSVRLGGIGGSLWNGHAAEVAVAGEYFSNLRWSLNPLSLLAGRLSLDTELTTIAGPIKGTVAVGLGGTVRLDDVSGDLSIRGVHPAFESNHIDGRLSLDLREVVLENGFPVSAEGNVRVRNLLIAALGPTPVGSFKADVSTRDSAIVAIVGDDDASIDLDGTLTIGTDRSYLFTGNIAETGSTSAQLQQQLRYLGSADANGRRPFRFEGRL